MDKRDFLSMCNEIYSKIKIVYYFLKCCGATEKQLNLVEQKI